MMIKQKMELEREMLLADISRRREPVQDVEREADRLAAAAVKAAQSEKAYRARSEKGFSEVAAIDKAKRGKRKSRRVIYLSNREVRDLFNTRALLFHRWRENVENKTLKMAYFGVSQICSDIEFNERRRLKRSGWLGRIFMSFTSEAARRVLASDKQRG